MHGSDLELIRSGKIPYSALITLRKGELADDPVQEQVVPLKQELIKLKGTGREWDCCYFDKASDGCTIYEYRPVSCRVLKCWDPADLLDMVNKDTLSRLDILEEDNPLSGLIVEHDRLFPFPHPSSLAEAAAAKDSEKRRGIQKLVNGDLRFRDRVVKEFSLKLSEELFYFGRPLFQLLQPFGIRCSESPFGLELYWPEKITLP